jgi:putative iron-dependent peroxidase
MRTHPHRPPEVGRHRRNPDRATLPVDLSPRRRPRPQPVLAPLTEAAIFLVLTVEPEGEEAVRDVLGDVAALSRSVGFRVPEAELTCVVGIGASLFDRLFAGPRPAELHEFRELVGKEHTAVGTPGDLLFHVRSRRADASFELAMHLTARLRGSATVVDETHGFRYFEQRDLLGFVDGTENPVGVDAIEATTIEDQDPLFAGGSYVVVQKYVHDLDAWNRLPTEQQEQVIGREKLTDLELNADRRRADSHITLNTVLNPDGSQAQILRDNMPFGRFASGTSEQGAFGTYFIGYSATPATIETMLLRMFLGDTAGNTDRLLDFSTAVTGSLFFVPSLDFLEDLPTPPSGVASASSGDATPLPRDGAPTDGSLGIGALNGSSS